MGECGGGDGFRLVLVDFVLGEVVFVLKVRSRFDYVEVVRFY